MENRTRHYHLELTDDEVAQVEALARDLPPAFVAKFRALRGDDEPRELARRLLYADYYGWIHGLAREALDAILDGSIADRDALQDWIHETADGSQRVIYTAQAWDTCYVSESADACEEETGERPSSIEVQAYFAICADVRSRLEAAVSYPDDRVELPEGFDLDDDSTWTATGDAT